MRARGRRNYTPTASLFEFVRIHMNFIKFFSNLRNFFLILKKRSKVTKFGYVFAKRLGTTRKNFPNHRSKRFANKTPTFFDKRGFQKLEKNLKKSYVLE